MKWDPDTSPPPRRIIVYGVCGTGKSTLARRLSEALEIPWFDVDHMAWQPGWVSTSLEEQRRQIEEVVGSDEWILDTVYGAWIDIPVKECDLLIGLDYPRWQSFWMLLKRTVRRVRTQEPCCNGNVETWRKSLSRDSILLWHFKSWKRKKQRMGQWLTDTHGPHIIVITDSMKLDRLIDQLKHHRETASIR